MFHSLKVTPRKDFKRNGYGTNAKKNDRPRSCTPEAVRRNKPF
nr:MAG TPA: hypothetical protein [Caudoviricetes sp.]DAX80651.1 MAG TPA: hypothetical protein [Caudoviricetes sp.]